MPLRPPTLGLLAAASLLVLSLTGARAADLDENYGYAEAPQEVPVPDLPQAKVEFGTGWYVRGDLGAALLPSIDAVTNVSDYTPVLADKARREVRFSGALGGGYSFNQHIRADLTAEYLQPSSTNNYTDAVCGNPAAFCSAGYLHSYDVLVNAYYDIGTWSIVTPYVGAGVGVGFGHLRAISSTPLSPTETADSNYGRNYYNFAFALMAGLSFDILPHTKLDIGYRYLNLGTVQNIHLDAHEARAGVRYMIDN